MQGNTWRKKYLSWPIMLKNNSYTVVLQEKKYITTGGLGGKHSFPDQITHTTPPPPQKSNGRPLTATCCSNDVIVQFNLSLDYIV